MRASVLALVALLLSPVAVASAAERPVASGQPVQPVIDAAVDGDVVVLEDGTFTGPLTLPSGKALTLKARNPGKAVLKGTNAADGIEVSSDNSVVEGIVVDVPAGGNRGILVRGDGVRLTSNVVNRLGAPSTETPAVDVFAQAAGTVKLQKLFVLRGAVPVGATPLGAIRVAAPDRVEVEDTIAFSAGGDALSFNDTKQVSVLRSTLGLQNVDGGAADAALRFNAVGADDATLAINSSILASSNSGATVGLAASTSGTVPAANAGNLAVTARHVTIGGVSVPVDLDADAISLNLPPAGGNVTATFANSIVRGAVASTATTGPGGTGTATLTVPAASNDTTSNQGDLFRDIAKFDFRLRANAVGALDKVDAPGAPDETDVEGQPRPFPVGGKADLGADEFVSRAPTVGFKVNPQTITEGGTVSFEAENAADPDPGGSIATVAFDFGDGTSQIGASRTATKVYTRPGRYTARVAVLDNSGTPSNVPTAPITVNARPPAATPTPRPAADRTAPTVRITSPRSGARLRRNRPVRIAGTARDAAGIQRVSVAVALKVGRRCRFYDGRVFRRASSCSRPRFVTARRSGSNWALSIPKRAKARAGRYEAQARASDRKGNRSRAVKRAFRLR